jgi:hypothetical protein
MSLTLPGGNDKGKPLSECSEKSLKFWRDRIETNIADGKSRGNDTQLLAAIKAELATIETDKAEMKNAGAHAAHVGGRALEQQGAVPDDWLTDIQSSFRKSGHATSMLQLARERANLITPATACGHLPEGCAVAFSVVHVDARPAKEGGEVYPTGGGKFGIVGSALNRIAAAAGVSWDPELTCTLDDRSDPLFCQFRAVGEVRHFDGTEQIVTGTVELDLREGSAQLAAIRGRSQGDPEVQIRDMRLFIVRHAESKAKNRAIRSLGMKNGYTQAELFRPFVVAKLMFTGQSDNPEIAYRFAEMNAVRMLAGKRALYGSGPAQMEPHRSAAGLLKPPPVGSVGADEDEWEGDGDAIDASGSSVPASLPEQTARSAAESLGLAGGAEVGETVGQKPAAAPAETTATKPGGPAPQGEQLPLGGKY